MTVSSSVADGAATEALEALEALERGLRRTWPDALAVRVRAWWPMMTWRVCDSIAAECNRQRIGSIGVSYTGSPYDPYRALFHYLLDIRHVNRCPLFFWHQHAGAYLCRDLDIDDTDLCEAVRAVFCTTHWGRSEQALTNVVEAVVAEQEQRRCHR